MASMATKSLTLADYDSAKSDLEKESSDDGWDTFVELEGLVVHRRPKDSLYEYKMAGELPFSARLICDMTNDIEYKAHWDKKYVKEIKMIERDPEGLNNHLYWQVKFPFPLSNRDYVFLRGTHTFDDGTIVLLDKSAPHADHPARSGVVRVDNMEQRMLIIPDGEERCKLRVRYFDDPKGNIPSWLVNMMASKGVPQYFETVKKAARGFGDFRAK